MSYHYVTKNIRTVTYEIKRRITMEQILTGNNFNGYEVLSLKSGLYKDILERQKSIMEHSLQRHSKVMQVRFDLHYPSDGSIVPSSDDISDFSYNFTRRLKRMNVSSHRVDPRYLWARELHRSDFPHYHFLLWVNANAMQDKYTIFDMATDAWCNVLNTDARELINFCINKKRPSRYDNGILINRNSEDCEYAKNVAFRAGSYLAKVAYKDSLNKFERKYNYSRV